MCHWHRNRKGFIDVISCCVTFSVLSLKYLVSPLSSLRLTKAHDGSRAAMDTLSNTALLSTRLQAVWRKERGAGEEGWQRKNRHSHKHQRTDPVPDNKTLSTGLCWCSNLHYQSHLCKLICQMPHVNSFLFSYKCVCVCLREEKHMSECAMCECLSENILNGTNSLKIHPHTVHLISMKMQNKKKNKKQNTTKATSNT